MSDPALDLPRPGETAHMQIVTVNFPKRLLEIIDCLVDANLVAPSRSELVRQAVSDYVMNRLLPMADAARRLVSPASIPFPADLRTLRRTPKEAST
jgi:Arc/MetJ-type ribon-helix-helix transcriptional regulator